MRTNLETIENYVRIEKQENGAFTDAVDHPTTMHQYVLPYTDFVVHPRSVGNSFEVSNLEEIFGRIRLANLRSNVHSTRRINAYQATDNLVSSGMIAQLYSLPSREYSEALRVQERTITDLIMS